MYKIVNDDWQQSEPQIFCSFDDAFKFHQKKTDQLSSIYFITEQENTKVWDPRWAFINPELESQLENINGTIKEIQHARQL